MPVRSRDLAIRILTVLCIISATAAGLAQAQKYDALLGTWDVKIEDGSREFVFEFKMEDGKLIGKYTGASGTLEMKDLTFENSTVKFNVTVGNDMVITYSAIVAEGRLSGTLSLQFGEAAITGVKRK
jgi:hypothetical protein